MKGNEISVKELRADAVEWLAKLHQTMLIKDYGKGSVRNYTQEMCLLFKYYNHKAVADIRQQDIERSGLFYFLQSVLNSEAFFNTHNVACSASLVSVK